jgi:hypothetical protein
VYPDTLMTAAVPEMKWWVTIEERLVKRLWRLATTLALSIGDSSLGSAAWLDVYYRKPAQSRSTSLGVSPVATPCVLNHTIAKKRAA